MLHLLFCIMRHLEINVMLYYFCDIILAEDFLAACRDVPVGKFENPRFSS